MSSIDRIGLLDSLMKSYGKAHPSKTKADIQKEVHTLWNAMKQSEDLEARAKALIQQFDTKAMKQKYIQYNNKFNIELDFELCIEICNVKKKIFN